MTTDTRMSQEPLFKMGLAEILLLLGILAVLGTLVYVLFLRNIYHPPSCLDTTRRLTVGLLAYAQDHDETLPLPPDWAPATGLASERDAFDCPRSKKVIGTLQHPEYGMNARLDDADEHTGAKYGVPLGAIGVPQNVELILDISGPTATTPARPDACPNHFPGSYTVSAFKGPGSNAAFRHSGSIVCSFIDGHVALLALDQVGKGRDQYSLPLKFTPPAKPPARP